MTVFAGHLQLMKALCEKCGEPLEIVDAFVSAASSEETS